MKKNWFAVGAVLLALVLVLAGCATELRGTDLEKAPAQDFRLTDQFGKQVALSDFRGQPVVLTFLYTSCPDVCPLIAERLRLTTKALGADTDQIGILAVSTDPRNDDVQAARKFSEDHGLLEHWHFLVGERAELEPIWKAYYIAAVEPPLTDGEHPHDPGATERIGHTDALFLIDEQGRMRSLLRSDFDPTALAEDLRALLRE